MPETRREGQLNKYIKQNCAPSWIYLRDYTTGCLFDKAWRDVLLLVNTVVEGGEGFNQSFSGKQPLKDVKVF